MLDPISIAEQRIRGSSPALPPEAARWRHAAFRAVYHAAVDGSPAMERAAFAFAIKAARELAWARIFAGGDR